MNIHVDFYKILLDSILENSGIKASIIVDAKGLLLQKSGNAMSLKDTAEDDETAMVTEGLENIYIKSLKDYFVIVFFDDKMSFERIKASVDDQVARFIESI